MKYKIEGIDLSDIPADLLIEIIKNLSRAFKTVAKSKFPEEGKNFELFINGLLNESTGIDVGASDTVILQKSLNHITKAFTTESPDILPKRAYNSIKNLVEPTLEKGGRSVFYNSVPTNEPLLQFGPEHPFPEYKAEILQELIEEEITQLGMIYGISGEEEPCVSVRLLNQQSFRKHVSKDTGILLGKHIYQWVDVTGIVKRKPTSMMFEEFDLQAITPNPRGQEIAEGYLKSKDNHSKYKAVEGDEAFEQFIRSLH